MTNTSFEIPSIEAIAAFMQAKKPEWPKAFCEYYAGKFWHSYQSKGWKISNNVRMKSWESAFYANWQDLKYEEHKTVLASCTRLANLEKQQKSQIASFGSPIEQIPEDRTIEYLDELLKQYKKHPTSLSPVRLASCYDILKKMKLVRLTPEQREYALKAAEKGLEHGKAVCVKIVFDRMAMQLTSFGALLMPQT